MAATEPRPGALRGRADATVRSPAGRRLQRRARALVLRLAFVFERLRVGATRRALRQRSEHPVRVALQALAPRPAPPSACLRALTHAALALPMLASSLVQASSLAGESALQIGRYQEGDRDLYGVTSAFDPIVVDVLEVGVGSTFSDLWRFDVRFTQDTWSGATPVAIAPQAMRGNRPTSPDGVSGATPYIEGSLYFDANLSVLETDGFGNWTGQVDDQLVHTISSASPETRQQFEGSLGRDHAFGDFEISGGVSLEPDFTSGFFDLTGTLDLDAGRTTLEFGLGYAHGSTDATIDHDAVPYIDTRSYGSQVGYDALGNKLVTGTRNDFRLRAGVVRLLDRSTRLEATAAYGHADGYLANPYKVVEVAFLDPSQQFLAPPGGYYGDVHALLERRPDARNEIAIGGRIARYVERSDTALRVGYAFGWDDWGIESQTFDFDIGQPIGFGFMLSPRFRYYTQNAADFYSPYLVSPQAYQTIVFDPGSGSVSVVPWNPAGLPADYTSDHRLAGFGTLGGGATLAKDLGRGIGLSLGFDYYSRAAAYQIGGSRRNDFMDFDAYTISGGLVIDLAALSLAGSGLASDHASGAHGPEHAGARPPAGVIAGHMLHRAGAFMLGYRSEYSRASGDMLKSSTVATTPQLVARACAPFLCGSAPQEMTMSMHMFELMFAPTRWLNLMIMPQYVSMEMQLVPLTGGPVDVHSQHAEHSTGGWGDLPMIALVRLFEVDEQRAHLGLGISAPTGSVSETLRLTHQDFQGYIHYGMQLGSGTWDLLPSLTFTGGHRRWSWGTQLDGVVRLEARNDSGYALGDRFRAQLWGGFAITPWLSGTLRGVYTWQDAIHGEYDGLHPVGSPPDHPSNYGGLFWDVGFGLRATVPEGLLRGQSLALEWVQPVATHFNGFQLERVGSLVVDFELTF